MGKVVKVQHSRKEWKCSRCGVSIPVGGPYFKGELNFSKPIIRCCKCGLEPWEVTTSDYQLSVGEILYRWHENYDASEDGRDGIVSELESIRDELQDRLDNMPEGLQQADTGLILQDRIDSLESAISDLENIDFEDEDYDEDCENRYEEEIDTALGNIEL